MNSAASSVLISGLGVCIPEKVVTNDDMAKIVETSDEWIRTRSGIAERRIAGDLSAGFSSADHPADHDQDSCRKV